jgi:hypothetical protein
MHVTNAIPSRVNILLPDWHCKLGENAAGPPAVTGVASNHDLCHHLDGVTTLNAPPERSMPVGAPYLVTLTMNSVLH